MLRNAYFLYFSIMGYPEKLVDIMPVHDAINDTVSPAEHVGMSE